MPPDDKIGNSMTLARPFSIFRDTIAAASATKATDFDVLGVGVELYFSTLVSLMLVFVLMGVANTGNLLTNIVFFTQVDAGRRDSVLSVLTTVSTLGARQEPFDMVQSAVQEMAATFIFIAYLLHMRWFVQRRCHAQQTSTITAADFTIEVYGLDTLYTDTTAFSRFHKGKDITKQSVQPDAERGVVECLLENPCNKDGDRVLLRASDFDGKVPKWGLSPVEGAVQGSSTLTVVSVNEGLGGRVVLEDKQQRATYIVRNPAKRGHRDAKEVDSASWAMLPASRRRALAAAEPLVRGRYQAKHAARGAWEWLRSGGKTRAAALIDESSPSRSRSASAQTEANLVEKGAADPASEAKVLLELCDGDLATEEQRKALRKGIRRARELNRQGAAPPDKTCPA